MAEERIHVSRLKVGLITIGLLVGAGVVWIGWPEQELLLGGLVRVGALMAAIWFAMPGGDREAAWAHLSRTTLLGVALVVLAVVFPRVRVMLLPLLPLLGVLWYLGRMANRATGRPNGDR